MIRHKQLKDTIERTLKKRDLVLVSNRGPLQFDRDADGRRTWRRGAGGLSTALHSVLTATNALWVAASMTPEDRVVAAENRTIGLPETEPLYWLSLIDIPPAAYELYYNSVSNKVLWFLQHYMFDALKEPVFDERFKEAWELGYVEVNRLFASSVAEIVRSDDPIVMIQDYHLYLVGGFLRALKPNALLFHFIHIPWCSPDYFRFLPTDVRLRILESLLANDIIGLHSWRYVRNFIHCCQDFLGCRINMKSHTVHFANREIQVRAYPISISVDELTTLARAPETVKETSKISLLKNKYQLIVRIDRAELSKNLTRGFDAFALLLKNYPEFQGKVKFLAYAYPTRESLREYQDYRRTLEQQVAGINRVYGTADWKPIELKLEDNYQRSLAAMNCFDVLLTNPIFDGMNLVAKEASALNKCDGVIVLSENAGAYEELRDGVLGVNPFDVHETMRRLHQALTMTPLERGLRANRLREIVGRNDVLKWLIHQLKDIDGVAKSRSAFKSGKTATPIK